ncbi:MAG: PIN domain-containing protein [bacterium]|nr:PIN domain-containing protein [bacterium]
MATRAFVDTGYFIARVVPRDQWHKRAVKAEKQADSLVTSSLVINETISLLQGRGLFSTALEFLQGTRHQTSLRVIYPDAVLQSLAWDLFSRHGASGANAVDCVSFAIMRDLHIKKAFTFDGHFRTAGFQILR